MSQYHIFRNYQDLVESYSQEPRDVPTNPLRKESRWFFAYTEKVYIFVKSSSLKTPSCKIQIPRRLNPSEFDTMLDFYVRRNKGEPVSQDAAKATQNQVYWYGIFRDMETRNPAYKISD